MLEQTGQRLTEQLAEYAASLKFSDIPAEVVEHLKLCLLDTLGCGLYGSTLPWTRKTMALAEAEQAMPQATIWGTSMKTSASLAALVNGTAVHAYEMDDLHRESIVHLGSVVITTALAMAQRLGGITGEELITAIVVGYEVGARVGMAAGTAHLRQGFHPTGTCGAFAAAAAAGKVLGLNKDEMWNALGIGGTRGAGLLAAQYGAMTKRLHAGYAAQSGVYAADLAARAFTGAGTILEEAYGGFLSSMAGGGNPEKLLVNGKFELAIVGFKPYACCGSNHTTIDCLLGFIESKDLRPEEIEEVRVLASLATVHHVGWAYQPSGVTTAQMNLQYCAAVTLLDRQCFVDQFDEGRLADSRIIELADRVHVVENPAITAAGPDERHHVKVQVRLRNGGILEAEKCHARGSQFNPMGRTDVAAKYRVLAGKVLPPESVRQLEDKVNRLEKLTSEEVFGLIN